MFVKKVPILIVGAGPVGLMMALELTRNNIPVRIIDQNPVPTQESRALGLHAKTLELFAKMELIDDFLDEGNNVFGASMFSGEKKILDLDFTHLNSPYPFIHILPQNRTERILIDHLSNLGVEVERNTKLLDLKQHNTEVEAQILRDDKQEEPFSVPYLIACDGAHSKVRNLIGAEFEGHVYEQAFVLGDVKIKWSYSEDRLRAFFHKKGPLFFFPMGNDRYRIVCNRPYAKDQDKEVTLSYLQKVIDERDCGSIHLSDPTWMTHFNIHHRQVKHYRYNRVFLVGDAAHIHSPAGGQGLNTGIQDAQNLAWKLALVERGLGKSSILDSYHEERYPIGKQVLKGTDKLTKTATLKSPMKRKLRDIIFRILDWTKIAQRTMVPVLAEINYNYRKTSLVKAKGINRLSWALGAGPCAGDRALDSSLIDDKNGKIKLYDILGGTPFHLLLFLSGKLKSKQLKDLIEIVQVVDERFPDIITTSLIVRGKEPLAFIDKNCNQYLDPNNQVHEIYGADRPTLYLIRPDNYIGFINRPPQTSDLLDYLKKILL